MKAPNKKWFFIFFTVIVMLVACSKRIEKQYIAIQPYVGLKDYLIDSISKAVKETYGYDVIVFEKIKPPANAFIHSKTPRYRADTLIRELRKSLPDSIRLILGVTPKDISFTKRDAHGNIKKPESRYADWGIFGLGFCPGKSCIVSTFRLSTNHPEFYNRLKKVAIHEIGHNLGLTHCPDEQCVMTDAAEKISTIDNVKLSLCDTCKDLIY